MNSLAFKFLWSWKSAAYYQDKYLRSLGMGLEQLTDYRDSLISESMKLEEKIAEIKDKLPERIEAIKDRIRRKTERYKNIEGRVKEFETLSHLFNIPSGYGVAAKNDIKPIESVSKVEIEEIIEVEEVEKIVSNAEEIEEIEAILEVLQLTLKTTKRKAEKEELVDIIEVMELTLESLTQ
ncbi:MAG: hypothetical protein HC892_01645 [Saprospiraceae bacterium]|nr:hypothetical protein [Saprospiraceae bacterium]